MTSSIWNQSAPETRTSLGNMDSSLSSKESGPKGGRGVPGRRGKWRGRLAAAVEFLRPLFCGCTNTHTGRPRLTVTHTRAPSERDARSKFYFWRREQQQATFKYTTNARTHTCAPTHLGISPPCTAISFKCALEVFGKAILKSPHTLHTQLPMNFLFCWRYF